MLGQTGAQRRSKIDEGPLVNPSRYRDDVVGVQEPDGVVGSVVMFGNFALYSGGIGRSPRSAIRKYENDTLVEKIFAIPTVADLADL